MHGFTLPPREAASGVPYPCEPVAPCCHKRGRGTCSVYTAFKGVPFPGTAVTATGPVHQEHGPIGSGSRSAGDRRTLTHERSRAATAGRIAALQARGTQPRGGLSDLRQKPAPGSSSTRAKSAIRLPPARRSPSPCRSPHPSAGWAPTPAPTPPSDNCR